MHELDASRANMDWRAESGLELTETRVAVQSAADRRNRRARPASPIMENRGLVGQPRMRETRVARQSAAQSRMTLPDFPEFMISNPSR